MAITASPQHHGGDQPPALSSFAVSGVPSRLQKARTIAAVLAADGVTRTRGMRMLDLGAGSGVLGRAVAARLGAECVQVDVEDQRLARDLEFVPASGDALPFPDGYFDLAVVNHVIEHVGDQRGVLQELRRVLKPGGVCYLATPNKYAIVEPHYRIPFLSWLPQSLADRLVRTMKRGERYDVAPLSHSHLRQLVTHSRFEAHDYTADIAGNPDRYHRRGLAAKAAGVFAKLLGPLAGPLSPSFVLTLRGAEVGSFIQASGFGSANAADGNWDGSRRGLSTPRARR